MITDDARIESISNSVPSHAARPNPIPMPRTVAVGTLRPAGLPIACYVLDDGQRILSGRQALHALTDGPEKADKSSGAKDGHFGRLLSSFIEKFGVSGVEPSLVEFWTPNGLAKGIEAGDFVTLLKGFSCGFLEGTLHPKQVHIGRHATQYLHALATTGLAALIDEATGYQEIRGSAALQRAFALILQNERMEWELMFPRKLAVALNALRSRPWDGRGSYPQYLADDIGFIYEMIFGPEISRELRRRNPNPAFRRNHHQLLSEKARGLLRDGLMIAEVLARQSSSSTDWRGRMRAHFAEAPLPTTREDV